jgi:flavin reductase (DIM6/NTAB) family NADH-FMN oxidoreductase RutF
MTVTDDLFRKALSCLAAGVSIISTERSGDRRGVTATAICSVSASPPTILACVNTATGTCQMIRETGRFAVNLLAEHHQDVAEIFAGRSGLQGDDRFDHGDWVAGDVHGLPILEGALAAIECRVDHMVEAGTHLVFFGIIEGVYVADHPPLLFHGGRFHALPVAQAA